MASEVSGIGNLAAERAAADRAAAERAAAERAAAERAAAERAAEQARQDAERQAAERQAAQTRDDVGLSDRAQDELATTAAAQQDGAKTEEAKPAQEGDKPHKTLTGEVHGRPVDPNDANDMFWSWLQESGRPAPRNEKEAREAYKDLAGFAEEHGFKVDVVEHERLDKLVVTNPEGKKVQADVVGNMGGPFGDQRWWFGDAHEPKPGVRTTNAADHVATGPEGPGFEPLKGQIFGRDAHPGDAHDMFWVWQQQSGRPAPRNAAEAREAYKDLAAFAQKHGFKVDVIEHERLDKLVITTPDGRQVKADVVANMGGNFGDQRWWFGDVTNEGAGGAKPVGFDSIGGVGNAPMQGFDWSALMDFRNTAPKYQFGRAASNFDPNVQNPQQAEALLESMIQAMQAQGLLVVGVDGDKIQVKTEKGFEWVSVLDGMGGQNPAFQWQALGQPTPIPTIFPPLVPG